MAIDDSTSPDDTKCGNCFDKLIFISSVPSQKEILQKVKQAYGQETKAADNENTSDPGDANRLGLNKTLNQPLLGK